MYSKCMGDFTMEMDHESSFRCRSDIYYPDAWAVYDFRTAQIVGSWSWSHDKVNSIHTQSD